MTITAPETEHRIKEFSALVECQRRLIEQLERGAGDVTSARIILDSLCASLSLCLSDRAWHLEAVFVTSGHRAHS